MHSSLLLSVGLASLVSAHQNFHQFWVNGVSPGYQVGIRMPPSNNPVTDVTSNDITCNVNGNKVPSGVSTVTAPAGASIEVQWDSSTHPGPITHMLFGPVADASQATGIGQWAKINEFDSQNGEWANQIMEAQNMTYTFKLPSNLATGDYLLRSEMLALHASETLDGAQFYVGFKCAQLHITGSSSGGSCSPEITLPGAYKDTDPDIYIPNFYNGFDISTYVAPGGPVATCGGSGGGAASPTTTPAAPKTTTSPTVTLPSQKTTTKPATTTLHTTTTAVAGSGSGSGSGTVAMYGQCGGIGYTGSTQCVTGAKCTVSNDYYSQCLPA